MTDPAPRIRPPRGSLRAWLERSDDYGFALILILATIIVLATIGSSPRASLLRWR